MTTMTHATANLVANRSRAAGFTRTQEQDRQHRYNLQLRGKLSDPRTNVEISRTNVNTTQMYPICPSTGGWPTSNLVTPYYYLEHRGMLEYALRVTKPPAWGNLGTCAQYSLNLRAFGPHRPHDRHDALWCRPCSRPFQHTRLQTGMGTRQAAQV